MFLGITAAAWSAIGAASSLAFGVFSAYTQAQQARQQAQYQRDMALRNQIIAENNVKRVEQEGKVAEQEQRQRISQAKGAARAVMGSSGFLIDDPNSTNVGLLADLAAAGEYDVLKIQDRTRNLAQQAQLQGEEFGLQAGLFQLKADQQNATRAAAFDLLSGAPKVAAKFAEL